MRSAKTLSTLPRPLDGTSAEEAALPVPGSGDRAAMTASWTPPEEFDDYIVHQRLGSGGMGHVYLGEDTVLARRVAIKFIAAHEPDAQALQRFLIEARAAGRVQHPNVVTVYRVGEYDERPYIVSEFARGEPLDRIAKPMEWRRALDIGVDLARGLAAAHRSGVLHCDIKPQNAIVTEEGPAKLLDFGLARLSSPREGGDGDEAAASVPMQLETMVHGTPDYMAPEVWRGQRPSRRSDVYSLGALLHELVTGIAPFGDVEVQQLPRAVQTRDPMPVCERAPGVDARLAAIIERCLRRDAADRFASGDDLRAALEQLARGADGAAPPAGNPYRGLRAFDADHRALFFGRSAEIGVVLDRLRNEHFLLITGESGVGKSSLCRAGVLPAVGEGVLGGGRRWDVATVVPGKHPVDALAHALAPRIGVSPADLATVVHEDRDALARELARHLGDSSGLLIFLDQTEELMTVSDARQRRAAEQALSVLAAGVPGVRLLSTLRADFLTRFAALPSLGEDLSRVLYFLRPMSPERTREVIVGPAEATGLSFETDEMVQQLVDATAHEGGGLPLLQFALAELWEARDATAGVVRASALDAMGGVGGALARHADTVLVTMPAAQRAEARRMLMRLVTLDDTRVRRTEAELRAKEGTGRAALDALVRGRLLVAHDDEAGSAYELAHEVLIRSWSTLRRWLAEAAEARAVRERLATSAVEWKRLGRAREALWSSRQLTEIDQFPPEDISEGEAEFLAASRSSASLGRWVRRAAAVGIPVALACAYGGAQLKARADLRRRVDAQTAAGQTDLGAAHAARDEADQQRRAAFALFDARDRDRGEGAWAQALASEANAGRAFRDASRNLEAGLALDPSRGDVRMLLAGALFERALLADAARRGDERDELVGRFRLYDDGSLSARWIAAAKLSLRVDAPHARVQLLRSIADERGTTRWEEVGTPSPLPLERALEPGSYLAVVESDGRAAVRAPAVLPRGGEVALELHLPRLEEVPEGFVYVPAGRFAFGAAGDEASRRGFFDTVPLHEIETSEYLIARHEVTWGQWLEYLQALPPGERAERLPRVPVKRGDSGHLELTAVEGGWMLHLQPAGRAYSARTDEPMRMQRAEGTAEVRWERLPVTGISGDDATAYTAWLDATRRLPGARLCTEYEWERGARGTDGRDFPHGATLAAPDANFDETHGKDAMAPAEVGAHPASDSPYGLADMSGNAFEWTTSSLGAGELVVRGGSYFHDQKTARTMNRSVSTATVRDATLGMRVCATPRNG